MAAPYLFTNCSLRQRCTGSGRIQTVWIRSTGFITM